MLALIAGATALTVGRSALVSSPQRRAGAVHASADNVYRHTVKDLDTNAPISLKEYEGCVSLVVNLASRWGLTATNYRELQALYEAHQNRGFVVLGFPCNQFGGQEPGSAAEIRAFADSKGATFPIFAKIDVNGFNTHPVYKSIKGKVPLVDDVKWNFAKFLVNGDGVCVGRYGPQVPPSEIEGDIVKLLDAQGPTLDGKVVPTRQGAREPAAV